MRRRGPARPIASRAGVDAATQALHYAAPVGEKEEYVERLLKVVRPFVKEPAR